MSPLGIESTSNYQVRYRKLLIERGAWKASAATADLAPASVIVRPARDARPRPEDAWGTGGFSGRGRKISQAGTGETILG